MGLGLGLGLGLGSGLGSGLGVAVGVGLEELDAHGHVAGVGPHAPLPRQQAEETAEQRHGGCVTVRARVS